MKCKQCDAELENLKNKRPKTFCNSSCRSKYWHKLASAAIKEVDKKHIELQWETKQIEPKVKKLSQKQLDAIKPPKVIATVITPEQSKEVLDGAKKAKLTRADVKALVPLSIKGFDRTEWINTKCNELGIK